MRKLVAAGFVVAVAVAVACTPSPEELCKRGIDTRCTKIFECGNDVMKQAAGGTVENCKAAAEALSACAAKTEQDQLCTTPGRDGGTYNLDKASDCSDAIKAQACQDFTDPAKTPAACAEVCK